MGKIELLPEYAPLYSTDKRYILLTGGRGSAKSFHVADFLLKLTYEIGHTILFTRWTMTSAEISIIPEFLDKIERYEIEHIFDVQNKQITNKKTGSTILFRGIKTSQGTQTANLKSIEGVTTWVIDEAEELHEEDIFDKINLSIRTKSKANRTIMVMNPSFKEHFIYKKFILQKRNDVEHIHTDYRINVKNLDKTWLEEAELVKRNNTHRYDHIFLGKWLEDQEGLLWTRAMINRSRVQRAPELQRIVVSIDPAITAKADSDETGIVVLGKQGRHGYVLEDGSGIYTPDQWSSEAKRLAEKWDADAYIAEKNQGGDMVENILRHKDRQRRIKLVTATKGKILRAEPVFSMYEQNLIFHVGEFPKLERQMITFNPDLGSPDRVDALVHGFTELVVQPKKELVISYA